MAKLYGITVIFFLMVAHPSYGGGLNQDEVEKLKDLMEKCVVAAEASSVNSFSDWQRRSGKTPTAYLSYQRFVSPDGAFRAYVGQIRSKLSPVQCGVIFQSRNVGPLQDVTLNDLREYLTAIETLSISGATFTRSNAFERDYNRQKLSACINGSLLLLNVTEVWSGNYPPMIELTTPFLEEVAC